MSKIKANFIIELMGRPPEHIKEALNTLAIKMGSEKGVSILNKKYHDPKPIEKSNNLFITFAEIDVEFETLDAFFSILMGYMPSHAEIYEPDKFKLDVNNLNGLGNFILSKLHRYDAIAKRALTEKNVLFEQLNKLKNEVDEKKKNPIESKKKKKTKDSSAKKE